MTTNCRNCGHQIQPGEAHGISDCIRSLADRLDDQGKRLEACELDLQKCVKELQEKN